MKSKKIKMVIGSKDGTSLIELMVSMLLVSIIMLMMATALSASAKIFVRAQKVQHAQAILDNVAQELQSQMKDAVEYIKIYSDGGQDQIIGQAGAASGLALEYLDTEGYVELLTTQGCEATTVKIGGRVLDTADSVPAGMLLNRYYYRDAAGDTYAYKDETGAYIARAVSSPYVEKYYMGNYLKVTFSYPDGTGAGSDVSYIEAHIALYDDSAMGDDALVAQDTVILNLRYKCARKDGVTAQ